MNIWDYILAEDIEALTDNEYESFRNYLRFMGHKVSEKYGLKYNPHHRNYVLLDHDGDLVWANDECTEFQNSTRIPLEEVKRIVSMGL